MTDEILNAHKAKFSNQLRSVQESGFTFATYLLFKSLVTALLAWKQDPLVSTGVT